MNEESISFWIKTGGLRRKQKDPEKIRSLINSSETNAKVAKSIPLNEETATLIFRELYESIRQLGDAKWGILGFEPENHEVSMEILKEFEIEEKVKLNLLDLFKKTRHDINYRGFRTSVSQTSEIVKFWDLCCVEIIKRLRKQIV